MSGEVSTATVYPFLVRSYAAAIYLDGTKRFTARDGKPGIPEEYHPHVKLYAATTYTIPPYAQPENKTEKLDLALEKGYINEQEYADTVALIPEQ